MSTTVALMLPVITPSSSSASQDTAKAYHEIPVVRENSLPLILSFFFFSFVHSCIFSLCPIFLPFYSFLVSCSVFLQESYLGVQASICFSNVQENFKLHLASFYNIRKRYLVCTCSPCRAKFNCLQICVMEILIKNCSLLCMIGIGEDKVI